MKFELTEPKKQYSNSELLRDLSSVAKKLGKNSISQREYEANGNFSYQTFKKRFGTWVNAVNLAGLDQAKRPWGGELSETRIPENDLIADMNNVADKLNKSDITIEDYDKVGKFGSSAICKRFGGWNKAKDIAGLKVGRLYNSTDEDYFENISNVWQALGRQPKYQEMVAPLSKLHISSYERKFGTWREALNKFIEYINSKGEVDKESEESTFVTKNLTPVDKIETISIVKSAKQPKRTNRIANLRQRFRVMKRDGFKCVLCGASPSTNPGCELHIDHIIAWSHGGETVEDNLRTLCSNCNLGRSNVE